MKNKKIKKYLPQLKGLIKSYGGRKSLSNPRVVASIIDEIAWLFRGITDSELDSCRTYLNEIN